MGTGYEVNYEDERFSEVESEKQEALTEVEETYKEMMDSSNATYEEQIEASKEWTEEQKKIQQEQTDFAIDQIDQQKEQAEKEYKKEQSGAYVDWQKESNKYGANAEAMAASGLTNTGYSESAQVSMYNTYQSRLTAARESFTQTIQNYDNAITEARLQNNAKMAEIAYQGLSQQLQLIVQQMTANNELLLQQMQMEMQVEDRYYSRYQDVLNQINYENEYEESIRQWEEEMQLAKEQAANKEEYNAMVEQYEALIEEMKKSQEEQVNLYNSSSTTPQSTSSNSSQTETSTTKNITPQSIGMKASEVLSSTYLKTLGLSGKEEVVASGGNIYIKVGRDYVEISPLPDVIDKVTKYTSKKNIKLNLMK